MCEHRNDSFDDGHEEENLEAELECSADVRRALHMLLICCRIIDRFVVSLVGVAIDGVLVHVQGKVAIDGSKEDRVDESGRWAFLTAVLHEVWSAHS